MHKVEWTVQKEENIIGNLLMTSSIMKMTSTCVVFVQKCVIMIFLIIVSFFISVADTSNK